MDNFNFGRSKEEIVMADLKEKGFSGLGLTRGSRGPFDVFGRFGDGSLLLVQVKSSRVGVATPIATTEDKVSLKLAAQHYAAKQAYIAYVVGDKIEYERVI